MGHPSLHTTLRTHTQFSTPTHGDFAVPRAASTSALSPRRGVTLSCCEVFHNGPKDICVVVWVLRGQSAGPTGNDRAEREREDGIVQCSLLVRHGRHSCLSPGGCAIRSCSAKGCINNRAKIYLQIWSHTGCGFWHCQLGRKTNKEEDEEDAAVAAQLQQVFFISFPLGKSLSLWVLRYA